MKHTNDKITIDIERALKLAAEEGARAGVAAYKEEKENAINKKRDRRLRNTKMLLEHYRDFKAHADGAIFDSIQVENEDITDLFSLMETEYSNEKTFLESVSQSNKKTKLIIAHIDAMLKEYEKYCRMSVKPEEKRRYRIVRDMYISPQIWTAEEISENYGIAKRTVYKDITLATEALAVLFFGIDGTEKKPDAQSVH